MKHPVPSAPAFVLLAALVSATALSQPVSVYPIRDAGNPARLSLNGPWDFRYVAGPMDAAKRPADFTLDAKITVPGNWELQGFAEPRYKSPAEGAGYYRRTFRVPANWRQSPNHIFLRLEGVLYGLDVWINGRHAGTWASAYNPCTFDITAFIHPDTTRDNTIEVRVTTRNKGWEFDTNDCWGLSGIYRDVSIFTLPEAHLKNFSTRTTLNPDGSADLYVAIDTTPSAAGNPKVRARLVSPDGQPAGELTATTGTTATQFHIATPKLWTAETPHLYTLELILLDRDNNTPRQTIRKKIGLRQITIENAVLKLNGTPIKLRGVDHHDIWPDVGRAATEEHMRRDLELMRAANINFIRTSHYPPHRSLLDLADEMGFYVMCEIPFGLGDKHLTDPSYQNTLYTRARATLERDQNHPSIIVWSVGNENPITDLQLETGREVKRLDPTRPICFPTVGGYFENNHEKFPAFVDIYAPHYPNVKTLTKYAQTLKRPVIVTEYAHALGLATERIAALWEIMQASPNIAGGAIWMFQDQGILRTGSLDDKELAKQPYVWPDATHYYDTGKTDGMDGIVYSDRTPQADYYEVRKAYSPVIIPKCEITLKSDIEKITIHLENRYDFRSLANHKLTWNITVNGQPVKRGEIPLATPAQKKEALEIFLENFRPAADAITILNLQCFDDNGRQFYERSLNLAKPSWESTPFEILRTAQPTAALILHKTTETIRVEHTNFTLTTNRATGQTIITAPDGRALVTGIYPHASRRFTEADKTRIARSNVEIWPETKLEKADSVETEAVTSGSGIILSIRTQHAATYGTIQGENTLLIAPNGTIAVTYGYNIRGKGMLLEAGLSFVMPSDITEYRWIGLGPLPSSPGKQIAAEYGCYHLTRGNLNFSGNRRNTDLAAITRPDGSGILVSGLECDFAVDAPVTPEGNTILSHNALISSRGNKGAAPELEIRANRHMSGSFILVPLSKTWPDPLTCWFGKPEKRAAPFAPYLRSYDQ